MTDRNHYYSKVLGCCSLLNCCCTLLIVAHGLCGARVCSHSFVCVCVRLLVSDRFRPCLLMSACVCSFPPASARACLRLFVSDRERVCLLVSSHLRWSPLVSARLCSPLFVSARSCLCLLVSARVCSSSLVSACVCACPCLLVCDVCSCLVSVCVRSCLLCWHRSQSLLPAVRTDGLKAEAVPRCPKSFKRVCKSFSLSWLPPLPQSRRRYRSTLPYNPNGLLGQI